MTEPIGEVAARVLRETDNPAVMRYDAGLCHLIGKAMGWKPDSWRTEQRVIRALTRKPDPLVPCWTRGPRNRSMRIFYLPEEAPHV